MVTETDTLVVGAGPQALTVAARWLCGRPALVASLMVVDPAGSWMAGWDAAFDRQRIDVLRSPGVHHPDPDSMAFIKTRDRWGRSSADTASCSVETAVGPLQRPTTTAFRAFCDDLLRRTSLSDRVIPAAVVEIEPASGDHPDLQWSARLSTGQIVRARQVVWAGNPCLRRVPDGIELGDRIIHGSDVDVRVVDPGQRIAVIGGGQTAGQLALEAARRGAVVTLLRRGAAEVADLDVDAGWLMDDHLTPFRAIGDPEERRREVERARRGSMTSDLRDALRAAAVTQLNDAGAVAAWSSEHGPTVGLAGVECHVDHVWCATGTVPDLRADPALAQLAAGGAPHVAGWPILTDDLEWLDGFHVVGALAALTIGPAAGNLGGARAAADILADRAPGQPRVDCSREGERRPSARAGGKPLGSPRGYRYWPSSRPSSTPS
ncbi:MAG: hypothetical protein AAF467_23290 [Actinomycetota bacterium]